MEFTTFVRKPFVVDAVEVTEENIEEVAKHVGRLRKKADGTPYILVDKALFLNVERVYIGFWVTKMGKNIRCYSRPVFKKQFVESNPDIETFCKTLNINFKNGGDIG